MAKLLIILMNLKVRYLGNLLFVVLGMLSGIRVVNSSGCLGGVIENFTTFRSKSKFGHSFLEPSSAGSSSAHWNELLAIN